MSTFAPGHAAARGRLQMLARRWSRQARNRGQRRAHLLHCSASYAIRAFSPTLPRMDEAATDEALMLAYAAGSAAAFEALYGRHRGPLFRFLQRALGHHAQAEECFQEVWSRVIQARARYRPEAKFTTWLYQIAHNLVVDLHRRQRPEVSSEDAPAAAFAASAPELQPEHAVSEFELRRRLQRAIEELPEEQRVALHLRLEQELSLEAIATITGTGRETVKSRLRYALDKLRARLS